MSNDEDIRRTVLPPLGDDGVRRWSGAAPDATAAPDIDTLVATIADTMRNFIDKLPDMVERLVENRMKASQAEVHAKIAESYGELRGELRGLLTGIRGGQLDPDARTRKGEFKFAGERNESDTEPIDLPSWRTGRNIIN
jgi:hypothetical protein